MQNPASNKRNPDNSVEYETQTDIYDLIDRLEISVDHAKSLPFSDSCFVDREEMLILVGMIREHLPDEIRQAKILLDQNRHIISEARKEAESIMREAEMRMTAMIDEHEITRKARLERDQILENANKSANHIRKKSVDYARSKLSNLEEELTEILVTVQRNKKELN